MMEHRELRRLIAAAACVAAAAALAEPGATTFKGHELGSVADLPRLKAEWRDFTCIDEPEAAQRCSGLTSIAEVEAFGSVLVRGDKTLGRVMLTIPESSFSGVRGALVERFGLPTRTRRNFVRDAGGTAYPDETCIWSRPDGAEITLMQRAAAIRESMVTFASKVQREADLEAFHRKRKQQSQDL